MDSCGVSFGCNIGVVVVCGDCILFLDVDICLDVSFLFDVV